MHHFELEPGRDLPSHDLPAEDQSDYFKECAELIMAGEEVWMARNFGDPAARIVDYYNQNQHWGFVELEFTDGLCDAFLIRRGAGVADAVVINPQRLAIADAMDFLAREVNRYIE